MSDQIELKDIYKFLEEYCENVEKGLEERWSKLPIENYSNEIYEVIGALLSRQSTLSIELANNPNIWNPHIAPIILRSMTDALITISWLMKDNYAEKAENFIKYGLGREKLFIEHYKSEIVDNDDFKEQYEELIKIKEFWLNEQRYDFLTEVDISSSWAGTSTRKMAQEANCENLYKFAYEPYCSTAHNTWQHISIFNLKKCRNPLHKNHKVPVIHKLSPDISFLLNSAKYLSRSNDVIDKVFELSIDAVDPYEFVFNYLEEAENLK